MINSYCCSEVTRDNKEMIVLHTIILIFFWAIFSFIQTKIAAINDIFVQHETKCERFHLFIIFVPLLFCFHAKQCVCIVLMSLQKQARRCATSSYQRRNTDVTSENDPKYLSVMQRIESLFFIMSVHNGSIWLFYQSAGISQENSFQWLNV